jgi:hypothetical protein
MTATNRPATHPVARPAALRPAAAIAAVPTVIRPRQDSALFRGWGVTL